MEIKNFVNGFGNTDAKAHALCAVLQSTPVDTNKNSDEFVNPVEAYDTVIDIFGSVDRFDDYVETNLKISERLTRTEKELKRNEFPESTVLDDADIANARKNVFGYKKRFAEIEKSRIEYLNTVKISDMSVFEFLGVCKGASKKSKFNINETKKEITEKFGNLDKFENFTRWAILFTTDEKGYNYKKADKVELHSVKDSVKMLGNLKGFMQNMRGPQRGVAYSERIYE